MTTSTPPSAQQAAEDSTPPPVQADAASPAQVPASSPAPPPAPPSRRIVRADFVEATPGAAGQWALASPFVVFVGWLFSDLFIAFVPLPWQWLNVVLAIIVYLCLVVLPLGVLAHWIVTSLPRIFQYAGWDVEPLEPVTEAEQYSVRYRHRARKRAAFSWNRAWLRAAQGWVYLEIFAIFAGAVALIPIFLSVSDYGFGR